MLKPLGLIVALVSVGWLTRSDAPANTAESVRPPLSQARPSASSHQAAGHVQDVRPMPSVVDQRACETDAQAKERQAAAAMLEHLLEAAHANEQQRLDIKLALYDAQENLFASHETTANVPFQRISSPFLRRLRQILGEQQFSQALMKGRPVSVLSAAHNTRLLRTGYEVLTDAQWFQRLGVAMNCLEGEEQRAVERRVMDAYYEARRSNPGPWLACKRLARASTPIVFKVGMSAILSLEAGTLRLRDVWFNSSDWPTSLVNAAEVEDCYRDVLETTRAELEAPDNMSRFSASWTMEARGV